MALLYWNAKNLLAAVDSHKYLAWALIRLNLLWGGTLIGGKANRRLGLIRRILGPSKDPVTIKTACFSSSYSWIGLPSVKPIFGKTHNSHNKRLVNGIWIHPGVVMLLWLICGSDKSFSERLTELNWSTLEPRRKYLCLVQLHKIIHCYSSWCGLYQICGSDWPDRN